MKMKRILSLILALLMLAGAVCLASCDVFEEDDLTLPMGVTEKNSDTAQEDILGDGAPNASLEDIPEYDGKTPYVFINDNSPFFEESEYTTKAYESYSPLDSLGRCGVVMSCIGKEIMPADGEERESISSVYPTGWEQNKYDTSLVEGGWLYNRSHLIGWQLTAENANKQNLITGTRYFNVQGMLPFENMVADYIRETNNHVLYRVTPIFDGTNLLAGGVLMEARSMEDDGEGLQFCVYVYNVQPGIEIDYKTGDNRLA